MRWFRFYSEALNDPKVQGLSSEDFRFWVNTLCIARMHKGRLPPENDMAYALRLSISKTRAVISRLQDRGLIDEVTDGDGVVCLEPHCWHDRQYKSDTSAGRMRRLREKRSDGLVTSHETSQ